MHVVLDPENSIRFCYIHSDARNNWDQFELEDEKRAL